MNKLLKSIQPSFLFLMCLMTTQPSMAKADFSEMTIAQLQQQMADGEVSSTQVVEFYLQRIYQHNEFGADLRAVISLHSKEDLLAQAQRLDEERKAGKSRGPMHGIPVLLKDNIDTGDGLANTAGSWLLRENFPIDDAFIARQLRQSGAIILGKANLSEWANFRSTESSSGWSSLGGQVKNPYDTTRSPCGSSSGSAVAVSANLVTVAVGTETDGSLICPAAINGIVSLKPTVGLLSRDGIIPISHSQDTAGPMARTVTDAVYLLQAMLGEDQADQSSYAESRDFTEALKSDGLKGKRIGVMRGLTGYHSEVDQIFAAQLEVLEAAGAILVDDLSWPNGSNWGEDEFTVLLHEFKFDLEAYLATTKDIPFKSLADLIAANEHHADRVLPWFGQELFTMAEARDLSQQAEYEQARKQARLNAGPKAIDALLEQHQLDLLIAPSGGPAWKIDVITGDHFLGSSSGAPAVAGYPHITVPMGFVRHLPVGLSFFSTARAEPVLIEAAFAYEQLSQVRTAPALQPQAQ